MRFAGRLCVLTNRWQELNPGFSDGLSGTICRITSKHNGRHPPEPRPPQAGYWCSRFARRPNVRLIWCGNDQIKETSSGLGYRNSDRSFTYARLNLTPLT